MRLYVSAERLDSAGQPRLPEPANALLQLLVAAGLDVFLSDQWRKYEQIEEDIRRSDALLALADDQWHSSTWRAAEVTFAGGQAGVRSAGKALRTPLPVFVMPLSDLVRQSWIAKTPFVRVVGPTAAEAASTILSALGK